MNIKTRLTALAVACAALSLGATPGEAQTPSTGAQPIADGTIAPGEYATTKDYGGMTLAYGLSADGQIVYLALAAPTSGWVAIGQGSTTMNTARIVMAFVADGKATISQQTGRGHGHTADTTGFATASAAAEKDGATTLEIALPAHIALSGGKAKLILAYGRRDDLTSMHAKRASAEIELGQR